MKLRCSLVVACILVLAVNAASAGSASATLTGLHFQVFDLAPNDGIVASVSFPSLGALSEVGIVRAKNAEQDVSNSLYGPAQSSFSVQVAVTNANGTVTLTAGDIFSLPSAPTATAYAYAFGDEALTQTYLTALHMGFTLSANSLLVVTANLQTSTSGHLGEAVKASSLLQLSWGGLYPEVTPSSSVSLSTSEIDPKYGPLWGLHAVQGQANFANLSDAPADGFVLAAVAASVISAPVPEPPNSLLFGVGCLAAALRGCRRRK